MSNRLAHIPEDSDVVVEAESLFHAQTLVAALADHGIEAMAAPEVQHGAGVHPDAATKSVAVIAHADVVEEARAVVRELIAHAPEIDWDSEVGSDDDRPLTVRVGSMPLVARAGLIAALLIVALMIVGAILAVVL
jgi:hypothetical protein